MNQSRNFTSLLNPSYLQNAQNAVSANAAAVAAAAAAAAVSAAIANGTPLNSVSPSTPPGRKRDSDGISGDGNFDKESKEERRKRRKTRWGGNEHDKTFIPGMPTVLPTNLTPDQERAYLFQLQIEEISRKLRTGDLGIPLNPEERFERNITYRTKHERIISTNSYVWTDTVISGADKALTNKQTNAICHFKGSESPPISVENTARVGTKNKSDTKIERHVRRGR